MSTLAEFRIPLKNLPPPNENGEHLFKFRITSEDGTRASAYSNLYTVESTGQIYPEIPNSGLSGSGSYKLVSSGSNIINITWNMPSVYYTGNDAQNSYKKNLVIESLLVNRTSAIDVSSIRPNIYLSAFLGGNTYRYKFFDKVLLSDAQNVVSALLAKPNVISASIEQDTSQYAAVEHESTTKWGVIPVDIFVKEVAPGQNQSSISYTYYGRTKENQIGVILANSSGSVRILGQAASYPPQVNNIYTLFDTGLVQKSLI